MHKTIKRRSPAPSETTALNHLPPILRTIFANRSIHSQQELDYAMANMLPPTGLLGIDTAAQILAEAVVTQKRILVVGDFDADGATSSALAVLALRAFGCDWVEFLVPNRFEYGYGLTPEIVAVAATMNPDLIVTVDNGISSIEGVNAAKECGIGVVVTDHHLPGKEVPDAAAIVNPNQDGCSFASKSLAGVGVIFYVLVAVRARLRETGWFEKSRRPLPNMAEFLDLVALGTVADVVPLDNNNRLLVSQGLNRIRSGLARPGIQAILEVAGRQPGKLVASDLGFLVGPRLNAAGRLDDMSLGIRCLMAQDPYEARELATELNSLNQDRRAIEGAMQKEALSFLEQMDLRDTEQTPWGLCLYHPSWHQGVVGILASRIKDRFHRPVIAFADSDDSATIKGSARSIPGLHIRDTLDLVATRHPELISKFGGHAMAAGLTLDRKNLQAFSDAFDEAVRQQISKEVLEEVILSDGELGIDDFNLDLAHAIRNCGPWGQAFPEPVFDGTFLLIQQRVVGSKHLKMVVAPINEPQKIIDAIAFNIDLEQWPNPGAKRVQLVYQLEVNEFRGQESVQLLVRHFWPV